MKKFISVMLVAAMAVTALTGCGSNSGSSSKKDADKYYIGGIGPTTGATAIYGTAVKLSLIHISEPTRLLSISNAE